MNGLPTHLFAAPFSNRRRFEMVHVSKSGDRYAILTFLGSELDSTLIACRAYGTLAGHYGEPVEKRFKC